MSENQQKSAKITIMENNSALSFLALLSKGSIYKIITILAIMAVTEIAVFCGYFLRNGNRSIDETFFNSPIYAIFLAAFGISFFLLMWMEGVMGDAGRNTMRRLKLSGSAIFFTEVFYNLFCLLLVYTMQVWLAILMLGICAGDAKSPQYLFLSFYRINFLHCLLPMAETGKLIRNILLFLAFAANAACGFGKRDYMLSILTFLLTALWFASPIGREFSDVICNVFYALGIAAGLRRAWNLRNFELTEI